MGIKKSWEDDTSPHGGTVRKNSSEMFGPENLEQESSAGGITEPAGGHGNELN